MTIYSRPDWHVELINIIGRQRDVYQQLHALGDEQSRLVADGDAEKLLTLLAKRQQLIDQLESIGSQLGPFRKEWPTTWSKLDVEQQACVSAIISEIQKLIEQIMEQDERDRMSLSVRSKQMAMEMGKVGQGMTLNKVYQQQNGNSSQNRYADRHG